MSSIVAFLRLSLQIRRRRIIALIAFALLFLAAGATARIMTGGGHGHVELDPIFEFGGTTLVSAVLLVGWLIGRFPLIATLVMMSGAFSHDRAAGHARLYAARPRAIATLYFARFLLYMLVAWALSMMLLPVFDMIILGEWPSTAVFAVVTAQVLAYGSVCALLTVFTRADAWVTLFLSLAAMVWDALRRMNMLDAAVPFIRDAFSVLLPPQAAMMRIEAAFGASRPVPPEAFLYVATYAALVFLLTYVALSRRQL